MSDLAWPALVIAGAFALALVSTVGDVLWFEVGLPHTVLSGLSHGTVLFACVGLYLGFVERRPAQGLVGGALIGFLAAGSFYVLAPLAGRSGMFIIWAGLWVVLAAFRERLASPVLDWRVVLARGGAAAVLSGAAFYAISGIWTAPYPAERSYVFHFFSWTVAYLPAFAALLWGRPGSPRGVSPS